MTDDPRTLAQLFSTLPQKGRVEWIGIRPARREKLIVPDSVEAKRDYGLTGDRYGKTGGKRQVTLIQWEHLPAMASMLGMDTLYPELLRRNIAVSGINLLALKDKQFRIGGAIMEYSGLCHPCSFMEETLGPGGYNAVRGHGGINAKVIDSGIVRLNDSVEFLS